MDSIIVTITDFRKSFMCDIEVQNNITIDVLACDIAEALNGYIPNSTINGNAIRLFCSRLNRLLVPNETLETAGVWNGDFLIIQGG
jgi:hypothetical protein